MKKVILFLKAHVDTYTRGDGTVVQAHDDSRPVYAKPHPSGKHAHGDQVFFPHPDPKKRGKNALGTYLGHSEDGKSVIRHDQGGGKHYVVEHGDVKPARGVPKPAEKKEMGPSFADYLRSGGRV